MNASLTITDSRSYPAYKFSGVEWLGDVPAHWEVLPNRAIFVEVNEQNFPDEQMLSVTIVNGVIRQKELLEDTSKKDSSRLDKNAYKLVQPGDIAYNKMRAWQGAVGVSEYRGIISPAYVVQRPRNGNNSRYLHHLLRTPAFSKEAERWSYGITSDMWSLRPEHFKMIYTCVPPFSEQSAIVRFLDHADQRIRHYIRAKQKLIALLEEQRQAIIHRTVTHGLDSNVRLKPSGVEGLGDVPAHWEVVTLGYLATKFGSGVTPRGGATVYQETGIPFLRSQNIHFDGLHLGGVARITPRLHQSLSNTHVKPGDVLLNITGASIGRVCSVPDHFSEGNVSQHVCIIRPKKNRLLSGFLASFLSTAFMQREIRFEQNGASREGLTLHSIRNFKIVLPTISEQQHILAEIRAHTERLAVAVTATRRQIALLQEYRTRLIADVVTGKLDVREAAAELPEGDVPGDAEESAEEHIIEEERTV